MRRGCISLGNIQCDGCHRTIAHSERYLAVEETPGVVLHLCIDWCLEQGYAHYKQVKGEQVQTFFAE